MLGDDVDVVGAVIKRNSQVINRTASGGDNERKSISVHRKTSSDPPNSVRKIYVCAC